MRLQQLVLDSVRLLEGKVLPAEEAAALANLIGSREELLAHLLLCRGSLRAYPEIIAAIKEAAQAAPGAASERPQQGDDAVRRQRKFFALDGALQALLGDDASAAAQSSAAAALRQFKLGD